MADTQFWNDLDEYVAQNTIVIDRPRGTAHPRYPDMIYPVDYGYIEGSQAADGEGIDVFIGSTGLAQVDGLICTVDSGKPDVEIKILFSCTGEEMETIAGLMNQGEMSGLLIRRA